MSLSDDIRKKVVRQKITKVQLNRFPTGRGDWSYDPVIHLEDGTRIFFQVDETEIDRYGIRPIIVGTEADT